MDVGQLSWGFLNDSLEMEQQKKENKVEMKTLVVASIYLAIQFLIQEKSSRGEEEKSSAGDVVRAEALKKFQSQCAGCKESLEAKEEKNVDYAEFSKKNNNWWRVHFNVSDEELFAGCNLILSIYE